MNEPQTFEEAKKQLIISHIEFANATDYIKYLKDTLACYKRCIYIMAVLNIVTVIFLLLQIHSLQNAM